MYRIWDIHSILHNTKHYNTRDYLIVLKIYDILNPSINQGGAYMGVTTNEIEKFCEYCKKNYLKEKSIQSGCIYQYQSLTVCILDCIYSLQAIYKSAENVVKNYADCYMIGNPNASNDTLESFIKRIGDKPEDFAAHILKNNQKLAGQCKASICKELARKLYELLGINTLDDFRNYHNIELLEIVMRSVKGVKDAAVNYLFMLSGDQSRCKPDVHILACVKKAIDRDVTADECQVIFSEATAKLKNDNNYSNLTVAALDSIIWQELSKTNQENKH